MKIILAGASGSGKGTLARKLTKEFGIPSISMGDLLRNEAKNQTEIGKQVDKLVREGKLVPADCVFEILTKRLVEDDCKDGFILDGFPRNLDQAKILESSIKIDKVIFIDIDKDDLVTRLLSRRVCPKCNYSHSTMWEGSKEFCKFCGTKYITRADDNVDSIKNRFEFFEKESKPMIEYFRNQNKLIVIDGNNEPDNVFERCLEALKEAK